MLKENIVQKPACLRVLYNVLKGIFRAWGAWGTRPSAAPCDLLDVIDPPRQGLNKIAFTGLVWWEASAVPGFHFTDKNAPLSNLAFKYDVAQKPISTLPF
ncbi:jg8519 [Pararge aegeria aegeria]|uniref:Jg8519 protein n=1 Tax=Pararge aegeria aegeria TaxID=348720 RepID=A0A8S4SHB3_9NEOP|nr:jg8519 [Pararge aegeria aegeria]